LSSFCAARGARGVDVAFSGGRRAARHRRRHTTQAGASTMAQHRGENLNRPKNTPAPGDGVDVPSEEHAGGETMSAAQAAGEILDALEGGDTERRQVDKTSDNVPDAKSQYDYRG